MNFSVTDHVTEIHTSELKLQVPIFLPQEMTPHGLRPVLTALFSSGSSKAFGSCPVLSGTMQLGMPSPGPEQEKQVVDGNSLPDLDVSDRLDF